MFGEIRVWQKVWGKLERSSSAIRETEAAALGLRCFVVSWTQLATPSGLFSLCLSPCLWPINYPDVFGWGREWHPNHKTKLPVHPFLQEERQRVTSGGFLFCFVSGWNLTSAIPGAEDVSVLTVHPLLHWYISMYTRTGPKDQTKGGEKLESHH